STGSADCGHRTPLPHWIRLSRLRLRGAARRLAQCAHDRAPRQLDLEIVVPESARIAENDLRRSQKALPCGLSSRGPSFGCRVSPWLVCNSSQRETCLLDRAAVELEAGRNRDERERIGQSIAQLQIRIVFGKAFGRQLDGGDDLVAAQIAVHVWPIA